MPWRIVFVCTGNICRSPTAEGVLRRMAAVQGLAGRIEVASAGLEAWHLGSPPDARSQVHTLRRGYALATLRARHFTPLDFERFDWVIAMDASHHARLRRLCPPQHAQKLRRAADFSDCVPVGGVPDPYYGDAAGFDAVLDVVEAACEEVLMEVARVGE